MKQGIWRYALALLLSSFLATASCAVGPRLVTRGANVSEVKGTYTLILYGCNYFNDMETVAIFGKEDGGPAFEPYAPDFNYRTIRNLPAKEALEQAARFVRCNSSYKSSQLSSVVDSEGRVLGFELRPLLFPFTFGTEDVIDTFYWIRNGKVRVSIRIKPSIQRSLEGDGASRERD